MPHRLYGHVDAAENYSVGRWCRMRARRSRRCARDGPRADPGRRHRALFQGADAGAFGGAADAARDPRRGARARCDAEGVGGAACRTGAAAIRRWPRGFGRATACASSARWRCWKRPAARSPTGTATACRRCSIRTRRVKVFLDAGPRRALPPDRRPVRRHAGGRRAGRGERARGSPARSAAAGHEGPRRALAEPASRRRDHARRSGGRAESATPGATPSGRSPGSAIRCRAGAWCRRRPPRPWWKRRFPGLDEQRHAALRPQRHARDQHRLVRRQRLKAERPHQRREHDRGFDRRKA